MSLLDDIRNAIDGVPFSDVPTEDAAELMVEGVIYLHHDRLFAVAETGDGPGQSALLPDRDGSSLGDPGEQVGDVPF